jgi:F-type H+-transporting ATPase subunit epsilon
VAQAQQRLDSGDGNEDDRKSFQRATAQLRAAQKRQ